MPRTKRPALDAGVEGSEDGISGVRAVDRAMAILRSFTVESPSMSVIEIQQRVKLSRPTLYRLLQTLNASGMIESEGDPQRFRLGAGVMQLAHNWLAGLNVVDVARPTIEGLREKTGETAAFFLMRDTDRLCVLEQRSRHVLSISRGVGDTGPITKGASGKAILAFMSDARRAAALDGIEPKDRRDITAVIDRVRKDRYALSRGEVFVGAVAIAAPVFDHSGDVMGSIGIFGPSARVPDQSIEGLAALVIEAAEGLSLQLGHRKLVELEAASSSGRPRRRKAV